MRLDPVPTYCTYCITGKRGANKMHVLWCVCVCVSVWCAVGGCGISAQLVPVEVNKNQSIGDDHNTNCPSDSAEWRPIYWGFNSNAPCSHRHTHMNTHTERQFRLKWNRSKCVISSETKLNGRFGSILCRLYRGCGKQFECVSFRPEKWIPLNDSRNRLATGRLIRWNKVH